MLSPCPSDPSLNLPLEASSRRLMRKSATTRRPSDNPYQTAAEADAKRYRRSRDLPALLPLWPTELADESETGARRIVDRLEAALRAERRRGRAGHWCYDLNRHMALVSALKAEREQLEAMRKRNARQAIKG